MEALEPRTLLSDTPLPAIADLEDSNNTVIRFQTTFGDVDIELFNSIAPITVNNFINNYVVRGKLDQTFFHRDTDLPGIDILQGGGFYFDNTAGASAVDSASPIVLESASTRGNAERTISMARTSDPNSGTSQFFFNVVDNTAQLPAASAGGYAVFGRVIQGWSVVQTISALSKNDISGDAPIAGTPLAGTFGETPTTTSYNAANHVVRTQDLVFLLDAEVIKPAGNHEFFAQRMVFPEGNRTDFSSETINLHNPNAVDATYQIIVRYEYGVREEVIASGTLAAGTSLAIPLSVAGQSSPSLVRIDNPYALVVESATPIGTTSPLPLAVSSTRNDFRATTSEEFFNVTGVADATLRTWDFARVERNSLSMEFITWLNLSDTTATITLTFYSTGSAPITSTYTTQALRRGGAEVFNLNNATLPAGVYGVRVTSTQNIVAELSDWDLAAQGEDPALVYTPGWAVIGTPGGTSTTGAIADAQIFDSSHTNILSFVNPSTTVAVITLSIWRTSRVDGDPPIQRVVTPIVPSFGRTDYSLSTTNLGLPEGEHFSVTYSAGSTVVAAQYTQVDETDRHLQTAVPGDRGVSTSATTSTAGTVVFTNASIDPTRTDGSDVSNFSLFNPFQASGSLLTYSLEARFTDGSSIAITSGTLTPNARLDVRLDQNAALKAKALTDPAFRTYSLVLRGSATVGATTHGVAGYAQYTRLDGVLGASVTSQGSLLGTITDSGSAIFLP